MFFIFLILVVAVAYLWLMNSWKAKSIEDLETSLKKVNDEYGELLAAHGEKLETEKIRAENELLHAAIQNLGNDFLNQGIKNINAGVTSSNLEISMKKVDQVFKTLKDLNIEVSAEDEKKFRDKIIESFKAEVKKDEARRQQQIIKEQIREEQRALAEREQEIKNLEKQTLQIELALEKARKQLKDEHSAEIEALKKQLAEAQEKAQRVKSQAELTKAGHVYVISNIGSFGENIFKVGMTRRLEPMDRIKELSDASVPFPFDVHMMISCEDAPSLETSLHSNLDEFRLNQVNMHKEFFRVSLDRIAELVNTHHGKISYRVTPDAIEFRESQAMIENREKNQPKKVA
jgi:hypothetical protein